MKYQAYLFDVQGTLLDFFTPVRAAVADYLKAAGDDESKADDVTRSWRADYFRRVAVLRQSVDAWHPVQDAYTAGFHDVCEENSIASPSSEEAEAVASSWRRLEPWPDTVPGLQRMRKSALIGSLSNTDMNTMVAMSKQLGIDWDVVLTAEVFGAFKPDPAVYRRAIRFLGLEPADVAMVACHPYDLEAAAGVGMGTVFVYRPAEYGRPEFAHRVADHLFGQRVSTLAEIE